MGDIPDHVTALARLVLVMDAPLDNRVLAAWLGLGLSPALSDEALSKHVGPLFSSTPSSQIVSSIQRLRVAGLLGEAGTTTDIGMRWLHTTASAQLGTKTKAR